MNYINFQDSFIYKLVYFKAKTELKEDLKIIAKFSKPIRQFELSYLIDNFN